MTEKLGLSAGQGVIGFLKKYFQSSKFMDRLATEIGVDHQIYKTALTEVKMNFAAYRGLFEAEASVTPNEKDRLTLFAQMSLEPALEGVKLLKERFPDERSIDDFIFELGKYAQQIEDEKDSGSAGLSDSESAHTGVGTLANFLIQQLFLADPEDPNLARLVAHEPYSAGYVVGFAEMGGYQFNGKQSPREALAFLKAILRTVLDSTAREDNVVESILGHNGTTEFESGRLKGEKDIADWIKTQGAKVPLNLIRREA